MRPLLLVLLTAATCHGQGAYGTATTGKAHHQTLEKKTVRGYSIPSYRRGYDPHPQLRPVMRRDWPAIESLKSLWTDPRWTGTPEEIKALVSEHRARREREAAYLERYEQVYAERGTQPPGLSTFELIRRTD